MAEQGRTRALVGPAPGRSNPAPGRGSFHALAACWAGWRGGVGYPPGVADDDDAAAEPLLVRAVRCPGCWRLPPEHAWMLCPRQAMCTTDGCRTVMWDMTLPPEEFKATATEVDLAPWQQFGEMFGLVPPPGEPGELSVGQRLAAEMGVEAVLEPPGGAPTGIPAALEELVDANREVALRQYLHSLNYRCAGGCGLCNPHRGLNDDERLRVRAWTRALVISLAVINPGPGHEQMRALFDPVGCLYGLAGLEELKAEIATL